MYDTLTWFCSFPLNYVVAIWIMGGDDPAFGGVNRDNFEIKEGWHYWNNCCLINR